MTTPTPGRLARATLYAGMLAGALDITAAILTNPQVTAQVVLQSVAGGWLGRETYSGGWPAAGLGLASHFAIMLVIAGLFVLAASRMTVLRRLWFPVGAAFGVAVWLAMTFVVVPLSASTLSPPADLMAAVKPVVIHILCVGLPIAWVTRRTLGAA